MLEILEGLLENMRLSRPSFYLGFMLTKFPGWPDSTAVIYLDYSVVGIYSTVAVKMSKTFCFWKAAMASSFVNLVLGF